MKTKLTLNYGSFFFCNDIQLKKGHQVEIDTDGLSKKDITILNAYISSGGILSTEGQIPVVIEDVNLTVEDESTKQVVEEKVEEVTTENKPVVEEESEDKTETTEEVKTAPKKTTKSTTKKTK